MIDQNPSKEHRREIIERVLQTFEARFYDPFLHGMDLRSLVRSRFEELLTTEDFCGSMAVVLAETNSHPTDFFHETERSAPLSRLAKATFYATDRNRNPWMFQDVLVDGPADKAGAKPGAILLDVKGTNKAAGEPPKASATKTTTVHFQNPHSPPNSFTIEPVPVDTKRKRDTTRYLNYSKPEPSVGYIRISMFPGVLGIDITKDTDRAIKELRGTKSLIVDLRGNMGSAGAGNLRLMSYLTPDKIPVGYSLTRRRAEHGYKREDLIRFERVPSSKLMAPFALLRFRKVDKSIVVVTEGLGNKAFCGKTVMLVNEHTVSGAEIVAGFAADHKLAVIVGTRTAGRTLSWSSLPVGHGYYMTIPIGNYLTWEGKSLEGTGVAPDVNVPFSPDAAVAGRDQQLEAAIEIARSI
jgi:C-terminal processing protease CtpA/Prc